MAIRVEFYGIARQRAGVTHYLLSDFAGEPAKRAVLADVLAALAERLPEFGRQCLVAGGLHSSLTANLDGRIFVSDPATPIENGQCLLILSTDAGG